MKLSPIQSSPAIAGVTVTGAALLAAGALGVTLLASATLLVGLLVAAGVGLGFVVVTGCVMLALRRARSDGPGAEGAPQDSQAPAQPRPAPIAEPVREPAPVTVPQSAPFSPAGNASGEPSAPSPTLESFPSQFRFDLRSDFGQINDLDLRATLIWLEARSISDNLGMFRELIQRNLMASDRPAEPSTGLRMTGYGERYPARSDVAEGMLEFVEQVDEGFLARIDVDRGDGKRSFAIYVGKDSVEFFDAFWGIWNLPKAEFRMFFGALLGDCDETTLQWTYFKRQSA